MSDKKDDLEEANKLFDFLQGNYDKSEYHIARKRRPKLTAEQAWTVIWFLGNQYWKVPDHIERCDVCGDLFDTEDSGDVLDYGKAPYFFCNSCIHTDEFHRKNRRNPDKDARQDSLP